MTCSKTHKWRYKFVTNELPVRNCTKCGLVQTPKKYDPKRLLRWEQVESNA